jgi:hypothetical protein
MPMNYCPSCSKEYAPHSAMCPPCNYWFATPAPAAGAYAESAFNKRQIAAFAGAALLVVGLFTPIVGVPFFTVNYYSLTQFSSLAGLGFFLLLLCGVGSVVLATMKRYGLLKWPGLSSLLILAYTFYYISSGISQAKAEMAKMATMPDGQANPFKGMGDAFLSMIQMQWGWGVLAAGAVLLIVAGLMKDEY